MNPAPGNLRSFCRGCGYDLTGASAGACPECGRAFDPADARSVDRRRLKSRRRRQALRLLAVGGVVALVLAFAPRGYVRIDATLTDQAGQPMGTSSAFAPIPPGWIGRGYGVWWTIADPSAATPGPLMQAHFSIVAVRREWLNAGTSQSTSTGSIATDGRRTVNIASETVGQIALRCARPIAGRMAVDAAPGGMMMYDMPEDAN